MRPFAVPFLLLAQVAAGCGGGRVVTTQATPEEAQPEASAAQDASVDGLVGSETEAVADGDRSDSTDATVDVSSLADVQGEDADSSVPTAADAADARCQVPVTFGDAGACLGQPPAPIPCGFNNAVCGSAGLCGPSSMDGGTCCGGTGACCAQDSDCCSGRTPNLTLACVCGTCSSFGNACTSDAGCNGGAACIARRCLKPPGATCTDNGECSAGCNGSGTCRLGADGDPCRSGADCRTNLCESGYCSRSGEGGQCQDVSDCFDAACVLATPGAQFGTCHCQHSGTTDNSAYITCCSGYVFLGICSADVGSYCLSSADCFGGTCTSSSCSCVGPQGECSGDTDCCAGATHCVGSKCQ